MSEVLFGLLVAYLLLGPTIGIALVVGLFWGIWRCGRRTAGPAAICQSRRVKARPKSRRELRVAVPELADHITR